MPGYSWAARARRDSNVRAAIDKASAQVKVTTSHRGLSNLSKSALQLLGISALRDTPYTMRDERLEQTIQRIENALTRIAAAADASASQDKGSQNGLADRHEAMRSKVRAELDKLDHVIGELEK